MKKYLVEILKNPKVASTYLPTPERCSIIGDASLNFRVRNGAGCFPRSNDTTKRSKNIKNLLLFS